MAREMKQAKLDPAAHEHVATLQHALQEQGLPQYVERADILSALVLYTPAPQLAGMLAEYWRYTPKTSAPSAADSNG